MLKGFLIQYFNVKWNVYWQSKVWLLGFTTALIVNMGIPLIHLIADLKEKLS